jgi:hypothetical protein
LTRPRSAAVSFALRFTLNAFVLAKACGYLLIAHHYRIRLSPHQRPPPATVLQ